MNWFERHLNWSAVIITFGGALFTCLMVLLTLGFNLFIPAEDIEQDFRYYLLAVIFTCTAVSVIGMAWVIRKKSRSLWSISFFIPSLFAFITLFFVAHGDSSEYPLYHLGVILAVFILIGIWLFGLLVMLFLKNKRVPVQPQSAIADQKPLAGDLLVEEESSKKVPYNRTYFYLIIALLVITLAVSGYSCFNVYHGYKVFIHEKGYISGDEDLEYSLFTFECPKNFYKISEGDLIRHWGEEVSLTRERLELFGVAFSGIDINVIPGREDWHYLPGSTLVEECIYYFYLTDYGGPRHNTPTIENLTVTQVSVDGIPTEYATFFWGEQTGIRIVCFEREGCIWVIRMENDRDKTVNPDPDFDHLIETFTIVD